MMFSGLMSRWMIPAAYAAESLRNLNTNHQDFIQRKRFFLSELFAKSVAIDQFSRDVVLTISPTDFINSEDVRMIQCRRCFGFLNEASKFVCIPANFFVEEFDRDFAVEFRVLGQIHFAHTTFTNL